MSTKTTKSRPAAKHAATHNRVGIRLVLAYMPPVPAHRVEAAMAAEARANWFASQAAEARGLGRDGTARAFEARARACRVEAMRELEGTPR